MKEKMRTYNHKLWELHLDAYPTCTHDECNRISRFCLEYEGQDNETVVHVRQAVCLKHAKAFASRYALMMPGEPTTTRAGKRRSG